MMDNGIICQMKADWMLPENKKLEVTLKILKDNTYQAVSELGTVYYCRPSRNCHKKIDEVR